jgi:hypothetical protein
MNDEDTERLARQMARQLKAVRELMINLTEQMSVLVKAYDAEEPETDPDFQASAHPDFDPSANRDV